MPTKLGLQSLSQVTISERKFFHKHQSSSNASSKSEQRHGAATLRKSAKVEHDGVTMTNYDLYESLCSMTA